MELFRSTFLIRPENYAKAAAAIRKSGIVYESLIEGAEDHRVIGTALNITGLFYSFADKGFTVLKCADWMPKERVDLMEQVFKAISKSVEPGTYIEFWDGDTIVRYDFLYDTVERCTAPHILYAKREVI